MAETSPLRQRMEKAAARVGQAATSRLGVLGGPARDLREAERTMTFGLPPEAVYEFWADEANIARVMPAPNSLSATGEDLESPDPHKQDRWELEIVETVPRSQISWRSTGEAAPVEASVRLRPAPASLGTEVTLGLRVVGEDAALPTTGTSAGALVIRTLRNAKSLMESGEIPTLLHNPAARPAGAPGGGGAA